MRSCSPSTPTAGTIEYTEFAPLMFDQLVAALSLTFLSHEATELEAYLADHFAAYDAERSGLLSRVDLKLALTDTDVLALSLHQVHAVLAEAPVEPSGLVEWAAFVPEAARLILKLKDPALEYKRTVMLARQSLPPLDTLTDAEGARLRSDLEGALASAPDGVLPALDAAAALAAAGLEPQRARDRLPRRRGRRRRRQRGGVGVGAAGGATAQGARRRS